MVQGIFLTWWQTRTSGCELKESFALACCEIDQNIDKLLKGGRLSGVSQLGLGESDDVFPGEHWALVTAPTK